EAWPGIFWPCSLRGDGIKWLEKVSNEGDQEKPSRSCDNDFLAAVHGPLRSFARRVRRRLLHRDYSHARVPLQHLLRPGLLSVLSVVQLLRRGVLLRVLKGAIIVPSP